MCISSPFRAHFHSNIYSVSVWAEPAPGQLRGQILTFQHPYEVSFCFPAGLQEGAPLQLRQGVLKPPVVDRGFYRSIFNPFLSQALTLSLEKQSLGLGKIAPWHRCLVKFEPQSCKKGKTFYFFLASSSMYINNLKPKKKGCPCIHISVNKIPTPNPQFTF